MRSIKFIFGVLFSFVLIGVIYFVIVDQYIIYGKGIHETSYKASLLDSLSDYDGKVIIIGGSDSHHGINAEMLEKLMNRPVINFGRNINIPLNQYIYNIKKHLKKEDIVVAVMSWPYLLTEQDLTDGYIKDLLNDQVTYSYYYKNLPFFNRVKLVFTQIPYRRVIKVILSRPDDLSKIKYQIDSIKFTINGTKKIGVRGESTSETFTGNYGREVNIETCDQYLISKFTDLVTEVPLSNAYPSNTTLDNLELLKSFKNQGVKVVFSWGIVVNKSGASDKCYESNDSKDLDIFADRVRGALDKYEIPVLGDYRDYVNPEECFFNSYAHIKKSCTESLTYKLYENGLNKYTNHDERVDSAEITRKAMENIQAAKEKYQYQYQRIHTSLANTLLLGDTLTASKFNKYITFIEGWARVESWGVWTEGGSSKLTIKTNPSNNTLLYMNGIYFNGDEETEVIVNGIKVGNFVLRDKSINLPEQVINSEILIIELRHNSPVSPGDLDKRVDDSRQIKFGLKEISLR